MHIMWYAQIHTVLSVDIDIFFNESFNWLTDWLIHYIKNMFVILKAYFIHIYHGRWNPPPPEMSGLLLLTSALSVTQCPSQLASHNPTSDICTQVKCIHVSWCWRNWLYYYGASILETKNQFYLHDKNTCAINYISLWYNIIKFIFYYHFQIITMIHEWVIVNLTFIHLILHAPGGSYCALLISSNLTLPSSNILLIKVF